MAGTKARDDFGSDLELIGFVPEFKFHPTRRWRWDWAYPDPNVLVAVEYHGFVAANRGYGNVGHTSINSMARDAEKATEGQLLGWIVITVNAKTVADGKAWAWVVEALERRGKAIA